MTELCACTMPFCDEEHAPYVVDTTIATPDDLDDWEGPMQPEYTENDFEAYDEMVRDDMRGAW